MNRYCSDNLSKPQGLKSLPQTGISILILCAFGFQLTACGLAFGRKDFLNALAEGKIKQGLTSQQVIDLAGDPDSTSETTINGRPVHLWFYHQTSKADEARYEKLMVETMGLAGYSPVYATESHVVVFSNNRVIGWDKVLPSQPQSQSSRESKPDHVRQD